MDENSCNISDLENVNFQSRYTFIDDNSNKVNISIFKSK